ncbi:Gfo/Idh/MocA family protein [Brachybacterium kimchii]|uniref:Gfo/Idh/MocA family oxidoreductase n=1 Tax=Brachybacterium kimchii TaxID=2942909 RepID=A0ABY4N5V2_9MICO|nr:Gfo/Idh/MocA family oxidoreductase [Brachybacterium kimchii]UQN28775.1 Gfo/Idh/MocA family oxidoreductase [Brachybacterium kimchii]
MIRIGILGAAGIAPQALVRPARRRSDLQVLAVAARSLSSARSFASEHDIPRAYEGYPALLADPDIDLVYVALPPALHAGWSIEALRAGKHVLCEKPFAMDAEQARGAVAIARERGLHLIEAFHDHYHPVIAELLSIIGSGALGRITRLDASFTADNPYSPTSIRHVPELGGGALMDLGCYPAHWIRTLAATEPIVERATHEANPLGADLTIDADLRIPDGPMAGSAAHLHASMAPGVAFAAPVEITGERGMLRIDNLVLPHRGHSITSMIGGVSRTWTVAGRETYDHELDAVVTALSTGRPADTEQGDIVATMELLDAIYAKARVARPPSSEKTPSYAVTGTCTRSGASAAVEGDRR